MWPFRPEKLSDVFSEDDLRNLLLMGARVGSVVTLVEALSDDTIRSISADNHDDEQRGDPFCTFFRHGMVKGEPAFSGADDACERCEQKFARLELRPPDGFKGETSWRRCHMGLTDYQIPVEIDGWKVGSLIAGRVVKSPEERERIRKIVSRLGTLTRAEAASSREDIIPITPVDEKARTRLLREIADIPLTSEKLTKRLREMADHLGRLASRHFQARKSLQEDELLASVESWPRDVPTSFGELSRRTAVLLDFVRANLNLEYLAFFARTPRELDETEATPSMIADSGLGVNTRKRALELEWSRVAVDPEGEKGLAARGHDTVSSASGALHAVDDVFTNLKDQLTKSMFFAPITLRPGREGGIFFGQVTGDVSPDESDYLFLARLTAAMVRRYYTLAFEVERKYLLDRLTQRQDRLDKYKETFAEIKAKEKLARATKGFTDFDLPKLVRTCIERAAEKASERGVEIDARSLPERLPLRAHRTLLRDAMRLLLDIGIERTTATNKAAKPSPLRIFLKRSREGFSLGFEAIGDFLTGPERRQLLRSRSRIDSPELPRKDAAAQQKVATEDQENVSTAGDKAHREAEKSPPAHDLSIVFKAVRRLKGRLRIDSERLHRFEDDPGRWAGKTTFLLELPESIVRKKHPPGEPGAEPPS